MSQASPAWNGVHVVAVDDYLASRDSEWMEHIYKFLGLTVGCILHDQPPSVRRPARQQALGIAPIPRPRPQRCNPQPAPGH